MKEQIENILIKVDEGTMPVQQALSEILLLFSVIGSFKNDKEHKCWANADFNNKCFICGKENCR